MQDTEQFEGTPVHVAVGVIQNAAGAVLLTRRADHVHQGGLWEFPGGKLEAGEDAEAALRRELAEEIGIRVRCMRPLLRVPHRYPDKEVVLEVYKVLEFSGEPHGREGQPLHWATPEDLGELALPAANVPIVAAVRLPPVYLVSGDAPAGGYRAIVEACLSAGVRLLQLRAKGHGAVAYRDLAAELIPLCHSYGARLLINAPPEWVPELGADGVHLNSRHLMRLEERPLDQGFLVGASCHDAAELRRAERLGLDFAVLSPVMPTTSHPGTAPLGWPAFRRLVRNLSLPVYALGGMRPRALRVAWNNGAQGIAALSGLWGSERPGAFMQACLEQEQCDE
jgi:8-oxo-dGTP diphosphatase